MSASAIWLPMVNTGFSEVIGSWKIMAISLPRMRRKVSSPAVVRSNAPLLGDWNSTCPWVM